MKRIITYALKSERFSLFKRLWKLQSILYPKYKNEVWFDYDGNSLAHHACSKHSYTLWNFTKNKPIDLNALNNEGKAPIHLFIENSFNFFLDDFEGYELYPVKIEILHDFNLLNELVKFGADVNKFMRFAEREDNGWKPGDMGSTSRKYIIGSALELLVYTFWESALFRVIKSNNTDAIREYEKLFHILTSLGANPNTIVPGKTIEESSGDMDFSYARVVSIFFTRFIGKEEDLIVIKPFLEDENTDFLVGDYLENTLLHTLFGRLTAKKPQFSDDKCKEIFQILLNNKSVTAESLQIKNRAGLTPIELIRGEASHLRKYMESMVLQDELNNKLNNKKELPKKINKI